MNILIAPNAFKSALNAADVADAIKEGLALSRLKCICTCFPIGDGGDGTAKLLIEKFNGVNVAVNAHDALGRNRSANFGLIDEGKTAVIELAEASGIHLLKRHELDPLHATTFGTGELMRHALDKGVQKIILCIGGSATIDGGVGILQALGVRFLDADKNSLKNIPASLVDLAFIDISDIDQRIFKCEIIILCDVDNSLIGETGSAKIFGPQKGATSEDVQKLEMALTKLRDITYAQTGKDMLLIPHGGAAGGVTAGLAVFLNAQPVNGIEYFLTITSFNESLQHVDLVITGEGSLDAQTLHGKGPYGIAKKAREKNIPIIGLAGRVPLKTDDSLQEYFDVLLPINHEAIDTTSALQFTKQNLVRTAMAIGNVLALQL
jgi:glycerate kinase